MTSRELVYRTLDFDNPGRAPRQMWSLPWAQWRYGQEIQGILEQFPEDIAYAPGGVNAVTTGDPFAVGEFTDEWGCTFTNIHSGVIGEIKTPLVADEDWCDADKVRFPWEMLGIDVEAVNAFCHGTDKFVMSGCCPRPFERLQFLRGTEMLYMDLADPPDGLVEFIAKMHAFYCEEAEAWCKTDIDALTFMDDWGAQNSLLIHPDTWRAMFAPLYKDYIDIAHRHGKRAFMHSDGFTLAILPDLIDMGLDAINTQLFCIGLDKLEAFAGKITFWGEIDRQHLLTSAASVGDVAAAVEGVHRALWRRGGCIAQCEFGPGGTPENVRQVYQSWEDVTGYGKE